jgi:hypothetical protein
MKEPRLKSGSKVESAYPLNKFPREFALNLGRNLVYIIATRNPATLEGQEWEQVFASCVGGDWKPSNFGLDDVQLKQTAWGAKTVKSKDPIRQKTIRLISGRNSPFFSYGEKDPHALGAEKLGQIILEIWNERVSDARSRFKDVRTVVLLKSEDFSIFSAFEEETLRYDFKEYLWEFNKNQNLVGLDKRTNKPVFTWQPHGSQFTIHLEAPDKRVSIKIKKRPMMDRERILKEVGFDSSWIEVL